MRLPTDLANHARVEHVMVRAHRCHRCILTEGWCCTHGDCHGDDSNLDHVLSVVAWSVQAAVMAEVGYGLSVVQHRVDEGDVDARAAIAALRSRFDLDAPHLLRAS